MFGPIPPDLEVTVDFTLEGEELARTTGRATRKDQLQSQEAHRRPEEARRA
jgi:hypothetical protein